MDKYLHLIGKRIHIIDMEGEPQYNGREGICNYEDSMHQLHGTWGGLAIQPDRDNFEVIDDETEEDN